MLEYYIMFFNPDYKVIRITVKTWKILILQYSRKRLWFKYCVIVRVYVSFSRHLKNVYLSSVALYWVSASHIPCEFKASGDLDAMHILVQRVCMQLIIYNSNSLSAAGPEDTLKNPLPYLKYIIL